MVLNCDFRKLPLLIRGEYYSSKLWILKVSLHKSGGIEKDRLTC